MLINKKFLALALLPLFGACVVTDSDDDAAGTETDVSASATDVSATAATMTTTTDSATMTTTTDSATMTTTTDSATMTTSETDPGDTTVGDTETTDTGGDAGFCAPTCAEAIDCCAGEPTCEMGIGTFPYAYTCEADGTCSAEGCTEDEQCTFGGVLPDYICADMGGFTSCAQGCAEDVDCQTPGFETYTCVDATYCAPPACTADADCAVGVCFVDEGFCGCADDEYCGGFGTCDTESGACGCADAAECPDGYACVTE